MYGKESTFKTQREIPNKNALSDDFEIEFSLPFLIGWLIKGHGTEVNKGGMDVLFVLSELLKLTLFSKKKKTNSDCYIQL